MFMILNGRLEIHETHVQVRMN